MVRRWMSIVAVGCVLVLAGSACAAVESSPQAAKSSGETAETTRPATTPVPPVIHEDAVHPPPDPAQDGDAKTGQPYEYRLYTHCGIEFAQFNGRYWRTEQLTDKGGGNPPRGWDNPEQRGTMTLQRDDEAVFHDDRGHEVIFRPTNERPPGCD